MTAKLTFFCWKSYFSVPDFPVLPGPHFFLYSRITKCSVHNLNTYMYLPTTKKMLYHTRGGGNFHLKFCYVFRRSYIFFGFRANSFRPFSRHAGHVRREAGDRKASRRQETGDNRQETEDNKQKTRDNRQETWERSQETGTFCKRLWVRIFLKIVLSGENFGWRKFFFSKMWRYCDGAKILAKITARWCVGAKI